MVSLILMVVMVSVYMVLVLKVHLRSWYYCIDGATVNGAFIYNTTMLISTYGVPAYVVPACGTSLLLYSAGLYRPLFMVALLVRPLLWGASCYVEPAVLRCTNWRENKPLTASVCSNLLTLPIVALNLGRRLQLLLSTVTTEKTNRLNREF